MRRAFIPRIHLTILEKEMKRLLRSPSDLPPVPWPMEPEPKGREPKVDRPRETRGAVDDAGAEKLDRSTVHRHDRRFSRDVLRSLRGSFEIEDDEDTRWWSV
jgi:hypothetical protein